MEEVEWNAGVFDSLVLPDEQRSFIHDLVKNHQGSTGQGFDDFVKDKGKGLIGLLSGPPGVGKTLTAEAIAEVVEKPLYKLSSGELGDSPKRLHENLKPILELTQLWGAVLLLDEADVFLVKRSDDSLTRNAITSIFLRELEYYQGILLLTTNRLTSIDQAFESRIHFCFEYEDLDFKARLQVWQQFLTKIKAQGCPKVEISDDDVEQLAKLDLNGRQIKNILSIAQSVANERKLGLNMELVQLAEQYRGRYRANASGRG
jgi:SpoVK/Ycf46/Vps4 family AAA+-type ATPase